MTETDEETRRLREGRIAAIETTLANAHIVDPSTVAPSDVVSFGATVTLVNAETDEQVVYQIVGQEEADIKKGTISYLSPLGKALLGKSVGDMIAALPDPAQKEVTEVRYI
ncbi:GreA/GreB family elongation factor [Streptomyces sp. NBC_00536]|uniref:GreA/GreB family elongation factor n=1 Tax=Streptomyces sp. NBC_00536 TaxID=2975769 RepID=UPI002E824684|nr:GreA/GreB family elongation factor [Streptomyces sp. NBC_00536]WUC83509.1 GreA/GreB family elongation factor [Streptomyces sp. NBC_00536]